MEYFTDVNLNIIYITYKKLKLYFKYTSNSNEFYYFFIHFNSLSVL